MTNFNYYVRAVKNYTKFDGRDNRPEFWYFVLFSCLIQMGLSMIDEFLGLDFGNDEGFLSSFYNLAVFLPSIAIGIRRMHDIDRKGWFILIPFYNIYLFCQPGTAGDNRFGPKPSTISAPVSSGTPPEAGAQV